jgi:hypothetical protein
MVPNSHSLKSMNTEENIIGEQSEEEQQIETIKKTLELVLAGAKDKGLYLFREPETIQFQFVEEGGKASTLSDGANVLLTFCMLPLVQAMQMGDPETFNWALAYLGENEDTVILAQ